MTISKFKATCLAVLERVRRTGKPLRITRHGVPVADVIPPGPAERPTSWLGVMAERGRIKGDILESSDSLVEWEATRK